MFASMLFLYVTSLDLSLSLSLSLSLCAGLVDKNVKFNIRQEHVGDTLEARFVRLVYAWCTLIYGELVMLMNNKKKHKVVSFLYK